MYSLRRISGQLDTSDVKSISTSSHNATGLLKPQALSLIHSKEVFKCCFPLQERPPRLPTPHTPPPATKVLPGFFIFLLRKMEAVHHAELSLSSLSVRIPFYLCLWENSVSLSLSLSLSVSVSVSLCVSLWEYCSLSLCLFLSLSLFSFPLLCSHNHELIRCSAALFACCMLIICNWMMYGMCSSGAVNTLCLCGNSHV